jgi:hypothetical protein
MFPVLDILKSGGMTPRIHLSVLVCFTLLQDWLLLLQPVLALFEKSDEACTLSGNQTQYLSRATCLGCS